MNSSNRNKQVMPYDSPPAYDNNNNLKEKLMPNNETVNSENINISLDSNDFLATNKPSSHSTLHENSLYTSILSFVCANVGAGILAFPSSLGQSGWFGVVIIVLVGVCCIVTARWLCLCMFTQLDDAENPRLLRTYEDIGVAALGRNGRRLVLIFQSITQVGVGCVFLILMGTNMNALVDNLTTHVWIFIFGAIVVPVIWLKTMREISYLAYLGVTASLVVSLVIIIKGGYITVNGDVNSATGQPIIHAHDGIKIGGVSLAINTIAFGFSGHTVLPAIVAEMKDPKLNYNKFSVYSYILTGIAYSSVAIFGYAGFGSSTDNEDGNILSVLDDGKDDVSPLTHTVTQIARVFIITHVMMAYPIIMNPFCLAFEAATGINRLTGKKELTTRITVRSLIVLFTVFTASVIPFFGDFLSLVSALTLIAISFVFPTVFYYMLYRHRVTFTKYEKALMGVIFVVGIASAIVGVYYAIKSLINDIENKSPFSNYFTN